MSGREVLTVGAVFLIQVGDGIQAESIDSGVRPVAQHVLHGLAHGWVFKVQVRLVVEEAVPVVLLALFVVGPVGVLGINKDDACVQVL